MASKGAGHGPGPGSAGQRGGPVPDSRYARLRVSIGRHPSDLIRIVVSAGVVFGCLLVARAPGVNPVEAAISSQVERLPESTLRVWQVVAWVGWWPGIAVSALIALYLARVRMSAVLACTGVAAWALTAVVQLTLAPRPVPVLPDSGLLRSPGSGFDFPDARTAVIAALVTVAAPYVGRATRYGGWCLVVLVAAADVFLGTHLPLGSFAGAVLGWGTGSLCHVLVGAPGRRASGAAVLLALDRAGISGAQVTAVSRRLLRPQEYDLVAADGERLNMKIVRRLHRRAGPAHKLRRALASLEVENDPRLSTPRHEVEHEAYTTLLAERAGVGTLPVVLAGEFEHGPPFLIRRHIDGALLSTFAPGDVSDGLLDRIWSMFAALGSANIAHHDLRADNILIDSAARPRIMDFTFSRVGGPGEPARQDAAELLVSLTSVVGAERAIASIRRAVPRHELDHVVPHLQRLALHRTLRRQLATRPDELAALRARLAEGIGVPEPAFRSPIRPSSLAVVLAAGLAFYLLLPQLSRFNDVPVLLAGGNPAWLAATVVLGLAAVVASAVSVLGSSATRLPIGTTVAVQVAAAFTGRTTAAGIGFYGVNLVFLERLGLGRAHAVAVIAVNRIVMGFVSAVGTILGIAVIGGAVPFSTHAIPVGWLGVAVAALIAVAAIVASTSFGRRRIVRPARARLGAAFRELLPALRRPATAIQLVGGCIGFLLLSALGLVTSLTAFTSGYPLVPVLAVFVVGSTLGQLVPTPGGLGAVEAATIAGLTAIGVGTGDAVAAVLASRVLTFWLPAVPGIVVFRVLQRRGIV